MMPRSVSPQREHSMALMREALSLSAGTINGQKLLLEQNGVNNILISSKSVSPSSIPLSTIQLTLVSFLPHSDNKAATISQPGSFSISRPSISNISVGLRLGRVFVKSTLRSVDDFRARAWTSRYRIDLACGLMEGCFMMGTFLTLAKYAGQGRYQLPLLRLVYAT